MKRLLTSLLLGFLLSTIFGTIPVLAQAPAATGPFTATLKFDENGGATLSWTEMPGAFQYCVVSKKTKKLRCVPASIHGINLANSFTVDKTDNYIVEAQDENGEIVGGADKGRITATVAADPAKKDVVQASTEFGMVANLSEYANSIMKYALPVGIALSVIMTVYAGIRYMLSQGQPDKIKEAHEIIQGAVLGLIVLIMSKFLVNFLILPVTQNTSSPPDVPAQSEDSGAES